MAKPIKCKKCGTLNDPGNGKCSQCSAFIKGNTHGKNSKRTDSVKRDVRDMIHGLLTMEQGQERFMKFLDGKDKRTAWKAYERWLNETAGPVVKEVKSETKLTFDDTEASDEAKKFIDNLKEEAE